MNAQASGIAASLQRTAYLGIALAVLMLAIAPFLRAVHDLTFWLVWPVLLLSTLIALGIAAHLLFDAVLFRLVAANPVEEAGLIELDRTLAKMGLREAIGATRPLVERIAGSRRIIMRLRFFLILAIVLFFLLAFVPHGQGL
ncbi:hypothetical protein [Brucella pseudogrignonensis]|uniref:Uncharacterized protein n=1 Tax=Brucella pseudogrignonensis TaxID=419475 RepID=A0ABU1MBH8_9HYPH|nr:hypothetical protein [Brucella pseudogrignonensis]MDR6433405.1 hypothetical protein [Brucella pseudogrignonensis]